MKSTNSVSIDYFLWIKAIKYVLIQFVFKLKLICYGPVSLDIQ